MPAGCAIPIRLTIEQERYYRRDIENSHFLCNLFGVDSQALPLVEWGQNKGRCGGEQSVIGTHGRGTGMQSPAI